MLLRNYHGGYLPLIALMVLIKHYIRKFDRTLSEETTALDPHPTELMLRNHVRFLSELLFVIFY
jgi:uncharacterized protein YbgA (DUF1722 family)